MLVHAHVHVHLHELNVYFNVMSYVICVCVYSVEDTLDSVLGGSDDEAEEDAVISQVLDEIGIEVTGKVRGRHRHLYLQNK